MVDPQPDELQRRTLGISFAPLDVGEEHFFTGPKAWLPCRRGQADPDLIGIYQWWGYVFLSCNRNLDEPALL